MASPDRESQLEFFDLTSRPSPVPSRRVLGQPVRMELRHDQALLVVIAGLVGVTVVFALGVERGKELVRTERSLLVRQSPPVVGERSEPARPAAPAAAPKPKTPSKVAVGRGRYAIQVITFTQARRAKQELDRLVAQGERAFLVMRQGRTIVYVGPFPSKHNASERLARLKTRYSDCFVRSL